MDVLQMFGSSFVVITNQDLAAVTDNNTDDNTHNNNNSNNTHSKNIPTSIDSITDSTSDSSPAPSATSTTTTGTTALFDDTSQNSDLSSFTDNDDIIGLDDDDDDDDEIDEEKEFEAVETSNTAIVVAQRQQQQQQNGSNNNKSSTSVSSRIRKRADQVRTIFSVPDLLRSCDQLQVECWGFSDDDPYSVFGFRSRDMWSEFQQEESPDHVVVAVEATAICSMDIDMRRGATCGELSFPFVMGSNFVGVIHHCGPVAEELGLRPGLRVASILKWGANSKYVTVPAGNLCTVNNQLDAADVASLISSYLPAFQALHHGVPRPFRYFRGSMRGKRVLVTGGASLEAQAVLRLARWAGATELVVTAPRDHFPILKRLTGVTVLDEDPEEWLPMCQNRMNVVIDYRFPKNFNAIRESLGRKARLVCIAQRKKANENSFLSQIENFIEYSQLSLIKRATMFDFAESFETYPKELHEDMSFLLKLLSTRQVRPQVDSFIRLKDVPKAHRDMESRPLAGSIICEPWKD